ncbi:MAG: hypothetical protein LBV28_02665 [Puniceicoccales bacterium]|nr:hypothetical protein [Puniceicoccales bacterium]
MNRNYLHLTLITFRQSTISLFIASELGTKTSSVTFSNTKLPCALLKFSRWVGIGAVGFSNGFTDAPFRVRRSRFGTKRSDIGQPAVKRGNRLQTCSTGATAPMGETKKGGGVSLRLLSAAEQTRDFLSSFD